MTDLSRHELLALKEIRLTGQTTQTTLARQLLDKKIIVDDEGFLDLTSKGRTLLVRGSPVADVAIGRQGLAACLPRGNKKERLRCTESNDATREKI